MLLYYIYKVVETLDKKDYINDFIENMSCNYVSRDPNRICIIIDKIKDIWNKHPDLRFGQLFYTITYGVDIFNLEDDKLEKLIDNFRKDDSIEKNKNS